MKVFDNLTISKRLTILVVLAIVASITASLIGVFNSRRLSNEINIGYEAITRPLAAIDNARGEFNAMRVALYDLSQDFNSGRQNQLFLEKVMKSYEGYKRNILFYKNVLDTYGTNDPYEAEAVNYLYDTLDPLYEHVKYIASVAEKAGRSADAILLLRGDFLQVADDIIFELATLTEILEAQTLCENEHASSANRINNFISLFIAEIFIVILLVLAYKIVRSITRPLKEITSVAQSLSEGKLDARIAYRSNNELGVLADSFRLLTQSVANIISDVRTMAENQSGGDIEYFIDPGVYKGAYYEMVVGINEMMRMSIDDVRTIVQYLHNLSNGDFTMDMKRFPGKKAVISDNIAELVSEIYSYMNDKLQAERSAREAVIAIERANAARAVVIESLNYASKIQRNLLPKDSAFAEAFADYSIIWNPKDIVGGDVYWIRNFSHGAVLCVCDCTGHGIPGAMLTMLVTSILGSVITEDNCSDTAQIIWELEQRLISTLNVEGSERQAHEAGILINDGCDLAVLYIDNSSEIRISTANTHVFICDGKNVRRIRGQKLHVGDGQIKSRDAIDTIIVPPNPDNKFYIASDGLYDQIGGEKKLPFGYRRFSNIILENHVLEQKHISEKVWIAFENYRGDEERRDDVELITFRPEEKLI